MWIKVLLRGVHQSTIRSIHGKGISCALQIMPQAFIAALAQSMIPQQPRPVGRLIHVEQPGIPEGKDAAGQQEQHQGEEQIIPGQESKEAAPFPSIFQAYTPIPVR